jgi:hypothetical protein
LPQAHECRGSGLIARTPPAEAQVARRVGHLQRRILRAFQGHIAVIRKTHFGGVDRVICCGGLPDSTTGGPRRVLGKSPALAPSVNATRLAVVGRMIHTNPDPLVVIAAIMAPKSVVIELLVGARHLSESRRTVASLSSGAARYVAQIRIADRRRRA